MVIPHKPNQRPTARNFARLSSKFLSLTCIKAKATSVSVRQGFLREKRGTPVLILYTHEMPILSFPFLENGGNESPLAKQLFSYWLVLGCGPNQCVTSRFSVALSGGPLRYFRESRYRVPSSKALISSPKPSRRIPCLRRW
jgi:hypothetical protein